MSSSTNPTTLVLTGQLPFILIFGAVLAFGVSLGLLRFYRRAVLRSMRLRTKPAVLPPPLPASDATVVYAKTNTRNAQASCQRAVRGPLRAATIYACAGLAYAIVMTVASLAASGISLSVGRVFVSVCPYAWPAVLAICIVATASRKAQAAIVSVYFMMLGAGAAFGLTLAQIVTVWAVPNLVTTLLLLAFLTRRIRAVGPLVFTFLVVAITGSQMAVSLVALDLEHGRWISGTAFSLGLGARSLLLLVFASGFAAFALLGWIALRWIRGRYERKKITDQSLTVDAIFVFFAVVHSIFLAFGGPAWTLWGLVALALYKFVVVIGFRFGKIAILDAPKLLLLRVFSLGRRSERMFDAIALHWRHVGSMQLIAGPDLATTTVEPHEFLDFVAGKLSRRFIDGAETFERRLGEMDLTSDFDGRYRVNDFFCHDHAWRMVLSRLVRDSDAVLMDLRGFSPANAGCVFEIQELVQRAAPERVVFVIDQTTDERFRRRRCGPLRVTVWESFSSSERRAALGIFDVFSQRCAMPLEDAPLPHRAEGCSTCLSAQCWPLPCHAGPPRHRHDRPRDDSRGTQCNSRVPAVEA